MNRILKATAALVVGVTLASQTGCGNEPPEDLQEVAGEAVKYGAKQPRAKAVAPELVQKLKKTGSARVLVQLTTPHLLSGLAATSQDRSAQQLAIASAQQRVMTELAGTEHRITRQFETIPFLAMEVSEEALAQLERSQTVLGVEEDKLAEISLAQSVPLVGASIAQSQDHGGQGTTVAILDTGVSGTHPFLSGKLVAEACYSAGGNCPNGSTSQLGAGAGQPCTYAAGGCQHGTHVAGIAAGKGSSFSGVAPEAKVIAIQVFSRFTGSSCIRAREDPCALSYTSDQIAGLERVLLQALRDRGQVITDRRNGVSTPRIDVRTPLGAEIQFLAGDSTGDGLGDMLQTYRGWKSIPQCAYTGSGFSCTNAAATIHDAGSIEQRSLTGDLNGI